MTKGHSGFAQVSAATIAVLGAATFSVAADAPRLREAFAGVSQTADHIMVVDTSGSMVGYWKTVAGAIADYSDALPDGDHVSIICFDTEATNSRVLPRTLNERSRRELRAELLALPLPRGQRTDLGRGLTKLVEEIARPGANELQFIFLVSDFVHEPADGSSFTTDSPEAQPWKELAGRARLALGPRLVQSFALLLPLDGRVGRDLPLVRAVLGETEGVPIVNQNTLREWFDRRRAETTREKLRVLVRRDLERGWRLSFERSGRQVELKLSSQLHHLPLTFTPTVVTADGVEVDRGAGLPTEVAPGQAVSMPLRLFRPVPSGLIGRLLTTRRTRTESLALAAEGTLRLEPADELSAALQVEPSRPIRAEATLEVPVTQEGTPAWLQAPVALALVVLGWAVWRAWLRPAPPVAAYTRAISLHGPGRHETVDLPVGVRAVTIGNDGRVDTATRMTSPPFAVRLLSRKPAFPLLQPRRGLYVVRVSGDVYYEWEDVQVPVPEDEGRALNVASAPRLYVRSTPRPIEIDFEL